MSDAVDWSRGERPNVRTCRVNVDFPAWVVDARDLEARRLGVTRHSLIKLWIAERLPAQAAERSTGSRPRPRGASERRKPLLSGARICFTGRRSRMHTPPERQSQASDGRRLGSRSRSVSGTSCEREALQHRAHAWLGLARSHDGPHRRGRDRPLVVDVDARHPSLPSLTPPTRRSSARCAGTSNAAMGASPTSTSGGSNRRRTPPSSASRVLSTRRPCAPQASARAGARHRRAPLRGCASRPRQRTATARSAQCRAVPAP